MRRSLVLLAVLTVAVGFLSRDTPAQGTSPSPEMTAAMALIDGEDWPAAEAALAKVVRSEPGNGRAWFNLGLARHKQEKWGTAIEAFMKTVEIGQAPAAMYNVAAGYARLGKKDLAFEWLEKALTAGAAGANLGADADLASLRTDPRFARMLEAADRAANPCKYFPESRQFDFWIGNWDVLVGGRKVGENLVELELKGCTLVENWKNLRGGLGKSLNSYNAATGKWKQFYVDSSGSVLEFEGGYKDKVMRLEGETTAADGAKTLHILEFHDLPDKTVRQWWRQSTDGGKTWTTVWDSIYVRKK